MDHTLWNKYGAALANSSNPKEAIEAYSQAVALRPNYVRTLVNIGLAYQNNGDFNDAARHYLNALVLNPKAKHIWLQVRQTLIQGQRTELIPLLSQESAEAFREAFPNLLRADAMPAPEMDSLFSNKIFQE